MTALDEQERRIEAVLDDSEELSFEEAVERFYQHLLTSLQLPCEVTGIEDFRF